MDILDLVNQDEKSLAKNATTFLMNLRGRLQLENSRLHKKIEGSPRHEIYLVKEYAYLIDAERYITNVLRELQENN